MTKEQIKAIAEEVAHLSAFDGGYFPHEKEIREDYEVLIQWLNEKYCIVDREKVMEIYNESGGKHDWPTEYGRKEALESLFGKEMFNPNKIIWNRNNDGLTSSDIS